MSLHHAYLTAMTVLFIVVFALMLHSLVTHRGSSANTFGGPSGRGQWLWALVPLAILAAVDVALIELPGSPPAAARNEAAGSRAEQSAPAGEAVR